jgi:hypothetical protein
MIGNKEEQMVYGLWLLIISFFRMPIVIWNGTRTQLETLAKEDQFNLDTTASPCMTWIAYSGKPFITVLNVIIFAVGVASGIYNLYCGIIGSITLSTGVILLIAYPIAGYLGAVLMTWILGYWIELLMLGISVANDINALRKLDTSNSSPGKGLSESAP